MTICQKNDHKNLADELGISKNTVRNQLVNAGYDLARYKDNGVISVRQGIDWCCAVNLSVKRWSIDW